MLVIYYFKDQKFYRVTLESLVLDSFKYKFLGNICFLLFFSGFGHRFYFIFERITLSLKILNFKDSYDT